MKYCVFYVKNEHGVSADVVKEMIETDGPVLTHHLSTNPDVDMTSIKVEKLIDSDDFVVTVDVHRTGMKWEPIQTVHLIVAPDRQGEMMM